VEAWVKAEVHLEKSGTAPLTLERIQASGLLTAITEWGVAQLSKNTFNERNLSPRAIVAMKDWVMGLNIRDGAQCLSQGWCASGKVGLNLIVFGMKFWIATEGPTADWSAARDQLLKIFDHIGNIPSA
jgi:hypothetical protein